MSESPLSRIAFHRDANGELLDVETAAVELLNILRPTVAIARFLVFAAHALHLFPKIRTAVHADPEYRKAFVQEVRRYYPFFPFVAATVRQDFRWRSHLFRRGTPALLDIYGTSNDPRYWDDPREFRPERFLARKIGPFEMIPQGGGDHLRGHRCPGEWITIELIDVFSQLFSGMEYDVPPQDLRIQMRKAPARIRGGFVIRSVGALT